MGKRKASLLTGFASVPALDKCTGSDLLSWCKKAKKVLKAKDKEGELEKGAKSELKEALSGVKELAAAHESGALPASATAAVCKLLGLEAPAAGAEDGGEKAKKKAKKEAEAATAKPAAAKGVSGKVNKLAFSGGAADFSEEEVAAYRKAHSIDISEPQIKPARTFDEAGFPKDIMTICKDFRRPTPIQGQSWPVLMAGRDMIGIAETGSGKTLAFLLPGLVHVQQQAPLSKGFKGPYVLVLAPTRELAEQSAEVCINASKAIDLNATVIYGGVPKFEQKKALSTGLHVVVATPGRLIDLMDEGVCDISGVSYLVLDEADRMLDMGFEPAMRRIVQSLPSERQTVMFSATWPKSVQNLAAEFMQNAIRINIGSDVLSANHRVTQNVEVMEGFQRDKRLTELLRKHHTGTNRVIVFVLYKKEAHRVEEALQRQGFKVCGIHGDKDQNARNAALAQFKKGEKPVMVATDVAARGLDIPDVEYVINYSFPLTIEDYVHRIGRTGRAGKEGVSFTFFQQTDKPRAGELQNVLREAGAEIPAALLKFGSTVKKKTEKDMFAAPGEKATKTAFGSDSDSD